MAASPHVSVHFERGVFDARPAVDGVSAELFDRDNKSMGEFDLVIDGMGVHSTLRHHRVQDLDRGKQKTGLVLIHGVINAPEESWSSELLAKMGCMVLCKCWYHVSEGLLSICFGTK